MAKNGIHGEHPGTGQSVGAGEDRIRREVANQQLLEFYMNVYKDFKAQS